jgi:hypothetical protein
MTTFKHSLQIFVCLAISVSLLLGRVSYSNKRNFKFSKRVDRKFSLRLLSDPS